MSLPARTGSRRPSSLFRRAASPTTPLAILFLAHVAFCAEAFCAEGGDLAIAGGTVHTADGQVIPDGVVVVEKGRIRAVGARAATPIPAGIRVVSAGGRTVIPGLVDPWGDLPGSPSEGGQADLRAVDALDPSSGALREALAEGITTLGIAPQPSRGVGGLGSVLKLRSLDPPSPSALVLRAESHLALALGLPSPALGTPRISTTDRLEQYYALRGRFTSARDYRKSWDGYWESVEKYNQEFSAQIASAALAGGEGADDRGAEEKPEEKKADEKKADERKGDARKADEKKRPRPPEKPKVDLQKEVFLRALSGQLPVVLTAHHRADLGYALRLKGEFGLDLTVAGASEGSLAGQDLAAAKVRAAVGPALLTRWSLGLLGHQESTAADLAAAGVPVALSGLGGEAFPSRALRLSACVAVRGGLAPEKALRAITAEPAAVLGLSDRVGTIAPGRDGDLVVLDGDPLSALTRVVRVIVEGRVVFERERDL